MDVSGRLRDGDLNVARARSHGVGAGAGCGGVICSLEMISPAETR